MTGPSYPAARTLAKRLAAKFGSDVATIEDIVSTAFWASLRNEEGRSPKLSLALLSPEQSFRPLKFLPSLRLEPEVLARLAPAVERPGVHIGISRTGDELSVWGMTRTIPKGCFVLEVVAPGLLVVKHSQGDPAVKFA